MTFEWKCEVKSVAEGQYHFTKCTSASVIKTIEQRKISERENGIFTRLKKSCINLVMDMCAPAHRRLAEALVEADQSAEHLLAVWVQLLQLVLYQHCVLRRALLNQMLSKHDQPVNAFCGQGDVLLETLQREDKVCVMNMKRSQHKR